MIIYVYYIMIQKLFNRNKYYTNVIYYRNYWVPEVKETDKPIKLCVCESNKIECKNLKLIKNLESINSIFIDLIKLLINKK